MKVLITIMIPILGFSSVFISANVGSDMVSKFDIGASLDSETFAATAILKLSNDGLYKSGHSRYYFGYYFDGYGWISIKRGNLMFSAGKFIPKDEVSSPYSLFISSERNPYVSMMLTYENNLFFFKTQWLELTKKVSVDRNVPYSFDDRGMNYRTVGLKLGNFRVGYQESIVYTKRAFDFEYFFNPLPNFFTQYINFEGRPFTQGTNDSSILGFFADYRSKSTYSYIQILVDDINMNRFYGGFQNPDKIAFSLGGKINLGWFEIHAYGAGSTEYTFEPSTPYVEDGYTHYPQIVAPLGNSSRTLQPEENYIGYKYGENTLSFMFGVRKPLKNAEISSQIELVLSGSKAPTNPWHGAKSVPSGTHMLDDDILEKVLIFRSSAEKSFGDLKIHFEVVLSRVENPLKVVSGPNGRLLYQPEAGLENSVKAEIGFSYEF